MNALTDEPVARTLEMLLPDAEAADQVHRRAMIADMPADEREDYGGGTPIGNAFIARIA